MSKSPNATSRSNRKRGTKTPYAKAAKIEAYYKRFRNGKSRHNG